MKFTTINEILRKKLIDTYYTYKQEYMPDTEDEPEIEDEFDVKVEDATAIVTVADAVKFVEENK